MCIRQLGPLVGGAISLALNVKTTHVGKVSYNTYLGLIAISSLGAPFALLLSQPEKVERSDGTKIPYMKETSISIEARALWKQMKSRRILLLIPVFIAGQWGVTYQGNYLTGQSLFPFSPIGRCLTRWGRILHCSSSSIGIPSNGHRRVRWKHPHRHHSRLEPCETKVGIRRYCFFYHGMLGLDSCCSSGILIQIRSNKSGHRLWKDF